VRVLRLSLAIVFGLGSLGVSAQALAQASMTFDPNTPNEALPQTDEACSGSDRRFMTSSGINQSHWDRSTA
jgi:hypothetical protein